MRTNENILTNDERRYFGLDPIGADWERVEIKPGFDVYFDGDVIRKTIPYRMDAEMTRYAEYDVNIQTRDRLAVLPQTAKGTEKKLNYTSVSGVNPSGCSFEMNLCHASYPSNVGAYNSRNHRSLPITGAKKLRTLEEYRHWLAEYIATCPPDYFEKVERMREGKHKTVKYYNGDIFRFEFDREYYGFGLIIGQVRKLKKENVLPKNHALRDTMMVPLLVRFYLLRTKQKEPSVSEIASHPMTGMYIMADNGVIWGSYDIVGSKEITESDIDFLVHFGLGVSMPTIPRLCWGLGMVTKEKPPEFPDFFRTNQFYRHSVHGGTDREAVLRAVAPGEIDPERMAKIIAGENQAETARKEAFAWFGLPEDISFDDFNRRCGGMTRAEYAMYANQFRRK
jgi:hypothetical protein